MKRHLLTLSATAVGGGSWQEDQQRAVGMSDAWNDGEEGLVREEGKERMWGLWRISKYTEGLADPQGHAPSTCPFRKMGE